MLKKIKKVLLYFWSILGGVILVAFGYFILKKDQIAEVLLLSLNDRINGEVVFEDISLNPFIQFPSISLTLNEFSFYENSDTLRNILEDPVAEFEKVYVAFELKDLFEDKITITKVIFDDGYLDLVKNPRGVFNFQNALSKKKEKKTTKVVVKKKKKNSKKTVKKRLPKKKSLLSKTLRLKLDKITLRNTDLEYNNQINGKQSNFYFHNLIATLSIMPDSITTSLFADTEIKKMEVSNELKLNNLDIELKTSLVINRNDSTVKVTKSKLILERAQFRLGGMLDLKGEGSVDLNIKGDDERLGFLSLLLSKSGIDNLETGNFYFNGKLTGNLKEQIPELNLNFGVEDLSLKIPDSEDSIKHLNFNGIFNSGNKENLSEAYMKIDTLIGELPGGGIDGEMELKNFTEPNIKYRVNLNTKLLGLEKVFRLKSVDSLSGKIELHDEFEGVYTPGKGWTDREKGNLRLYFDSLSFQVSNNLKIENASGQILEQYGKIRLKNVKIYSVNTDLRIDGTIQNFPNLIFDEGKRIVTNLTIQSKKCNLNDFLISDSLQKKNFRYSFSNLLLKTRISAKRNDLFEFKRAPRLNITIQKLNVTVDSLLAPLSAKNGKLLISENNDMIILDLKKMNIEIGNTTLKSDLTYYHQKNKAPWFKINLLLNNFSPSKAFCKNLIDSGSYVWCKPISGILYGDIRFSSDEKLKFKKIALFAKSLSYGEAKEKISFKTLTFSAREISYTTDNLKNPFATLSGKIDFSAERIKSKYYLLKDVLYKIQASNGTYTIIPENDRWFGVKAKGKYVLSPFANPPLYLFDYSVKEFSIGQFFTIFLEDSILTGKMDLALRLSFKGGTKDSIRKTLKGKIRVHGDDLTLHGLNVDDFLKNYKLNGELNLLDIGVVIYAGPIGLLATKGTNFARVRVTNRRKVSKIKHLVSDWRIKGDSLIADDVAFTTNTNRLALQGWYSSTSDSLDFIIGLLNEKGCNVLSQQIVGRSKKPELEMNNLFSGIISSNDEVQKKTKAEKCKAFYKGSLKHPTSK